MGETQRTRGSLVDSISPRRSPTYEPINELALSTHREREREPGRGAPHLGSHLNNEIAPLRAARLGSARRGRKNLGQGSALEAGHPLAYQAASQRVPRDGMRGRGRLDAAAPLNIVFAQRIQLTGHV